MTTCLPVLTAAVQHSSWDWAGDPDLWLYRDRTITLLRRYLHMSIEIGRVPSLLGREIFRARVTSYRMITFEDAVIFVHDVENCVLRLDEFSQRLIARLILQEYTEDEAARLLHCSVRKIERLLPEALDQLTAQFLGGGLLSPFPKVEPEPCQEGETQQFPPTDCCCGK